MGRAKSAAVSKRDVGTAGQRRLAGGELVARLNQVVAGLVAENRKLEREIARLKERASTRPTSKPRQKPKPKGRTNSRSSPALKKRAAAGVRRKPVKAVASSASKRKPSAKGR